MNVEIGTEAAQFSEKECIYGINLAVNMCDSGGTVYSVLQKVCSSVST
jgi:hypothetical protein